jgi:phosphoglycolate phosphatase
MELIEALSSRDIAMAIVSNKFDAGVKVLNEKFFAQYISVALGELPGVKRKPDPETVVMALQQLGVAPADAIYVGDSDVDIVTARNAGLRSVVVTWGFRDEEFLLAQGAETIIRKPLELLEFLE